jgi:hypothetical protein
VVAGGGLILIAVVLAEVVTPMLAGRTTDAVRN